MTSICVLIVAGIGVPMLQRTTQLYKQGLMNWDSPDYAAMLPPRVAQFRLDLQLVASRLARFAGKKSAQRIVRTTAASALAMSEVLFISSIMQMGLALPMAYYSSSYNDRIAIEYHGRSSDAATDARRINHARRRLHLAVAGQSSSANDHVCASRDRWYGAWPRSLTRSRPASCDAI